MKLKVARAAGGWNKQPNSYTVYLYTMTDKAAAKFETRRDRTLHPGSHFEGKEPKSSTGAWRNFDVRVIGERPDT